MADVFISYAREDQAFVRRLHAELTGQGRDVWVDWEGIPPSAEWMSQLAAAIDGADSIVFVLSPDSAASPICAKELELAAAGNKRIVPVLCRSVDEDAIPPEVAAHNWIDMREAAALTAGVAAIATALDTDLAWVQQHTRLLVRAREWDANERDRSSLLRGRDLDEAETWLAAAEGKDPEPTPLQTTYIVAGRRTAAATARVRFAAVAVALLVSTALTVFALAQRSTAQRETERAQVAEAEAKAEAEAARRAEESADLAADAEAEAAAKALAAAEDAEAAEEVAQEAKKDAEAAAQAEAEAAAEAQVAEASAVQAAEAEAIARAAAEAAAEAEAAAAARAKAEAEAANEAAAAEAEAAAAAAKAEAAAVEAAEAADASAAEAKREATEKRSIALTFAADRQADIDPELSALLAAAAVEVDPSNHDAEQALRAALSISWVRENLEHLTTTEVFSSSEAGVVTVDTTGLVKVWGAGNLESPIWSFRPIEGQGAGGGGPIGPPLSGINDVELPLSNAGVVIAMGSEVRGYRRGGADPAWTFSLPCPDTCPAAIEVSLLSDVLAASFEDGTVSFLRPGTGELLRSIQTPFTVPLLRPSGGAPNTVAVFETGSERVLLVDPVTGSIRDTLETGGTADVAFLAPDQPVTSELAGPITVWTDGTADALPGSARAWLPAGIGGPSTLATTTFGGPDVPLSRRVVAADGDERLAVWRMGSDAGPDFLDQPGLVGLSTTSVAPGSILSWGQDARVWDVQDDPFLRVEYSIGWDRFTSAAFVSSGGKLRVVSGNLEGAYAWDVPPATLPSGGQVTSVDLHGGVAAGGTHDGTVRIWRPALGTGSGSIAQLDGGGWPVSQVEFSQDGERLLAVDAAGYVRVWDTGSWELVLPPFAPPEIGEYPTIQDASFDPSGDRIAFAYTPTIPTFGGPPAPGDMPDIPVIGPPTRSQIVIRDIDGALLLDHITVGWPPCDFTRVDWSPDGRRIVTTSNCGVAVWNASTGVRLARLQAPTGEAVEDAMFDPLGRVVLTIGEGAPRLYDARNGELVHELFDPLVTTPWVHAASFTSRGALVTGGHDGDVVVAWDPSTGRVMGKLFGNVPRICAPQGTILADPDPCAFITSMAITEDGTRILAASTKVDPTGPSITVPIWLRADPIELVRSLPRYVTRSLDRDECTRYEVPTGVGGCS